jgi:endonuclease YncB( thermonuclease family)
MKPRALAIVLLLALAGAVTVTATASKRHVQKTKARVVGVASGDTLLVRIGSAKPQRVRILGVHAPTGSSCYARESTAATRELALGRQVTLLGDPKKATYVALPNGRDLGFLLLGRGAVQVDVWSAPFSRLSTYAPVQEAVAKAATGMWRACAADVFVSATGPNRAAPGEYVNYTVTVTNAGPLSAPVQVELRPGSYAKQLTSVASGGAKCTSESWQAMCTIDALASGTSVKVTMVLRPTGPGALAARAVASVVGCISAQCGAAPLQDFNLENDQAAASTIVPGGAYGLPGNECDPAYPTVCIPPPPPDLDCADFAPTRNFPLKGNVANYDPHHLDGNGDGIACQGDDY